jgi:large subunit ribosomal protein L9
MKVLLLEDVDNLGYAGDIKKVADGYARNYLIPNSLAELASASAIKKADNVRKQGEEKRKRLSSDAQVLANRIAEVKLSFERRSGESGKLYGSITAADIAVSLSEKLGQEIDKRKVLLAEPIREQGIIDVPIRLIMDVTARVKVFVNTVPEEAVAPVAKEEPAEA